MCTKGPDSKILIKNKMDKVTIIVQNKIKIKPENPRYKPCINIRWL